MLPAFKASSSCGPAGNRIQVTLIPRATNDFSKLPSALTTFRVPYFWYPIRTEDNFWSSARVSGTIANKTMQVNAVKRLRIIVQGLSPGNVRRQDSRLNGDRHLLRRGEQANCSQEPERSI